MSEFRAPVSDILRSLEVFGRHPTRDPAISTDVIGHFATFAEQVLAPLNAPGDRQHARLVDGRVRMPRGFADACRTLARDGWLGLRAPERFGGQGLDTLTAGAVTEIFAGANHVLQMLTGLVPGVVATLIAFGTPGQQARHIPRLISGDWLATMCLTEAGAGSDLSRIRCRARQDGDGWRIDGEKIFISGGDHDLSDGILHLVLARTGSQEGTRGLSLLLCPSRTGSGANGVSVVRLEEKLGLHASPTCQMRFDGARAELIGAEGQGLAAMFTLMNHARIDVALQGVGHAARAADLAARHASIREQGRRPDGAPAVLSDHPDVARQLAEQRDLATVARAMCHLALVEIAEVEAGGGRSALVQFLTPLVKIFATEAGIRAADLGIQILGGYGYLEDYGMAQVWRDVRITSIYEGANGIHALALTTRGLRSEGGRAIGEFAALVGALAGDDPDVAASVRTWTGRARTLADLSDVRAEAHGFAAASAALLAAGIRARIDRAG